MEEAGSDEMMNLVQEAHIASVDVGDDRLGDDEWNLLSNTPSLVGSTFFHCYFCIFFNCSAVVLSVKLQNN